MMVWQYGVGVGTDLVFLAYAVLEFIAYENAFKNVDSTTPSKKAAAEIVMS